MIATQFDSEHLQGRIVLRPNRSWSWRANVLLVATLMAVSGSVAVVFATQGLWMILPFTALELSVLFGCLYYCVRRTHRQEVLTFSPDQLVFESGVRVPQVRHRFQRYFTRILVRGPRHPWYRKQVALRCRDTEFEIGGFLSSSEKDDLVVALRDMIHRLDSLPARQST